MAAIGIAIRLLALLVMYIISNPKLVNLKNPEESRTLNMLRLDNKQEPNAKPTGVLVTPALKNLD